jgi:hypothetical protein
VTTPGAATHAVTAMATAGTEIMMVMATELVDKTLTYDKPMSFNVSKTAREKEG